MSAPHGYPANATYASPLCHVPFDINQPHFVPGTMVVNARSKIREQNQLDALRMDAQGQFYETESEAWVGYLFYLSSIFMRSRSIPRCLKYDNYDLSRQPFAGRPWSHLDAVKHYKGKDVSFLKTSNGFNIWFVAMSFLGRENRKRWPCPIYIFTQIPTQRHIW